MSWLAEAMREAGEGAALRARARPLAALLAAMSDREPPRGFAVTLARFAPPRPAGGATATGTGDLPAVIAEIKFVSPSLGVLRRTRDVETVARAYADGGAAALSILVDAPRFAGHQDHLMRARRACPLPLLAKGFFADPYQLAEMRLAGADAVLLIAAALSPAQLVELHAAAGEFGLDALVELHDPADLACLAGLAPRLVGVNHRSLDTLIIEPGASAALAPGLPAGAVRVAESGLTTRGDLVRMAALGFDAVLVGTALMRSGNPGAALATLRRPSGDVTSPEVRHGAA
jgi:indole-3-glycerol phosphate synthase